MKKGLLLSFIVMCSMLVHGQVYFLNEDFSTANGSTPLSGWTIDRTTGAVTDSWKFNNPGGRSVVFPVIGNFGFFSIHIGSVIRLINHFIMAQHI